MRILHGENTTQSRNQLFAAISAAKQGNMQIVQVDAKSLDRVLLEHILGSDSLFAEEKLAIISELHTLPKSKRKDELIEMLAQHAAGTGTTTEIILWEKRDLTATMLKKFPTAKLEHFKLSSTLFTWLDTISGQKSAPHMTKMIELFHKAVITDGDFLCFSMLIRQARLLIQAKEGQVGSMPPFMIGKLKKQTETFSLPQLLSLHHKLLIIDATQKTSQSRLNLTQELELLLVTL
jgi:hypothetical protein